MIVVYCKNTVDLYADNGKLLKNIRDGATAPHVSIMSGEEKLWVEIGDDSENDKSRTGCICK